MTDISRMFTRLEQQVIVLAATKERECGALVPSRERKRWFARLLDRILPDAPVTPLANERLEALRRLTCACFGSRGRPDLAIVRTALEAGLSSRQIATLSGLARRFGNQV